MFERVAGSCLTTVITPQRKLILWRGFNIVRNANDEPGHLFGVLRPWAGDEPG